MELTLLFANTFLLRVPAPGALARFGHLHTKPAVAHRADELGPALGDYDAVALCEVFHDAELHRILAGWPGERRPDVAMGAGPRARWLSGGSGLVTLSNGCRILRSTSRVFPRQGSRLRDADAWSAKGVLAAEIELPGRGGNLEVVSTHLFAGGGIREVGHRPEHDDLRFEQVRGVLRTAAAAHRRGNVMLIVGDFNIEAGTPAGERLVEVMAAAGYRDLWVEHGEGPGWTVDVLSAGEMITATDPDDPRFCLEPAPLHEGAARVDYAFLGMPEPASPPVTVQAFRRRVFRRAPDGPDHGSMPYLSDHAALHLELSVGA